MKVPNDLVITKWNFPPDVYKHAECCVCGAKEINGMLWKISWTTKHFEGEMAHIVFACGGHELKLSEIKELNTKYALFEIMTRDGEHEYINHLWYETNGTPTDIAKLSRMVLFVDQDDNISGEPPYLEKDLFDRIETITGYNLFDSKEEMSKWILDRHRGV